MLRRAAQGEDNYVMHIVTRANLNAGASREIYVKLPHDDDEPGDEEMCGQLVKAMYRTSDAAQNRERTCSEAVRELGFVTGKASL